MITLIYKKLEFIIIINCRVREGKTWHAPGFKKQKIKNLDYETNIYL